MTSADGLRLWRQRSEQYFTSSQTLSHALRHTKGRPQVAQVFSGRSDFLRILAMSSPPLQIKAQLARCMGHPPGGAVIHKPPAALGAAGVAITHDYEIVELG